MSAASVAADNDSATGPGAGPPGGAGGNGAAAPAFEFATAGQILFGAGTLAKVGPLARTLGQRALVAAGCTGRLQERLVELLDASGVDAVLYPVCSEPSIDTVGAAVQLARQNACDLLIGFGGGSALDTAKAAAAMLTNPGGLLDYLEVVGKGRPLANPPAPWIAIPTTAGTGSEVTRNAVISTPQRVKVSLRSPAMLARAAIIDPELTYSLPHAVTAGTGMDAIAQVLEPFVSSRANALTDLYCRAGLARGPQALLRAYHDGQDEAARADLAFTSLMGGLALANAGLGAVHGFAAPLGGMYDAPHGALCACLLPPVVRINARELAGEPDHPALERYAEAARLITGSPHAAAPDLAAWLDELRAAMHIPPLSAYGVCEEHFPAIIEQAAAASSMKANPIKLSNEALREILGMAV